MTRSPQQSAIARGVFAHRRSSAFFQKLRSRLRNFFREVPGWRVSPRVCFRTFLFEVLAPPLDFRYLSCNPRAFY
ncbi:hypothetical protein BT93_F2777 [Corymbia citriodora subsp. variegata]|nr:hypothetical protein BT93_F2777 [Corymbia citriodora subsp. variegata]